MRKNVSRTSLGAAIGVRFAIRAFWIDVDEAHLHRAERLRELAFAAVALIAEPRPLGTPEQLFRLPDIGAAAGKTEGFEAHRLQRAIAGKDYQVRPRNLVAVFLLDRPQQPARLVEVGVVPPTVQRRKTLLSSSGSAAAVSDAVRARTVPRHADEQSAVVAEVGRPPILRIRHERGEVLLQRLEVELLELLRVVERLAHRIGQGRVLVETFQVEPVGATNPGSI